MRRTDISVIMATYNRELVISRAINSLLKQTLKNWELIVVNDGSEDNTLEILENYKSNFNNIKVISQKHKNLSESRNRGIQSSMGSFVTFLDSDDEVLPRHLEARYNYMINNPETDLIHGGVTIIGDAFVTDRNDKKKMIPLYDCAIGGTFFGKRKVFEQLGGFNNIPYSEDFEFLERASKSFKVEKVIYPTYIYHRETPNSITNKISSIQ